MKQYFASFLTKPLKKNKTCSNSPAVNDNLKALHISAVFYFLFGLYNIKSPQKCLTSFKIFSLSFQILEY